ncbi:MAG: hypothetical protein ACYCYE_14780 [Clostridia bacterium]
MYNTTVIYILGIAIIAYGWVFVIKNFLVNYRASDNGFKNVAVMLLTVMAVIFAFGAAADAWCIEGLVDELQHSGSTNIEYRQLQERSISNYKRESVIYTISGFAMFIAAQLIYRNVKQEILRNLNRPKERWDWSKIRKNT